MKKIVFILLCCFFLSFNPSKNKTDTSSIVSELDSVWSNYGLFSYQIGETEPIIWIGMDETKNDNELLEHLHKHLPKEVLNHYSIEIFKDDIERLKKENEKEKSQA